LYQAVAFAVLFTLKGAVGFLIGSLHMLPEAGFSGEK